MKSSRIGSGDPSLGSDRFDESTKATTIIQKWISAISTSGEFGNVEVSLVIQQHGEQQNR